MLVILDMICLKYCAKKGISTILTAHNLEDQVETFFIRFLEVAV